MRLSMLALIVLGILIFFASSWSNSRVTSMQIQSSGRVQSEVELTMTAQSLVATATQLTNSSNGTQGVTTPTATITPALPTATQPLYITVVIALQDLPRGFLITEDFISGPVPAVGIVWYPAENKPENSFYDVVDIVGLIVRSDIPRESPILATQLVGSYTRLADVGSDMTLRVLPGYVGLPIAYEELTNLPRNLRYGEYVDVSVYLNLGNGQSTVCRLVERAYIVENRPDISLLSLGVEPQDALKIVWAMDNNVPILLNRRAATDVGGTTTQC